MHGIHFKVKGISVPRNVVRYSIKHLDPKEVEVVEEKWWRLAGGGGGGEDSLLRGHS